MKKTYQWQGTPCAVRFGYVYQQENTDKPMYWYNFECNTSERFDGVYKPDHMCAMNGKHFALIPAIEVTQGESVFLLANHHGIGISKLIKGGWPNHAHYSLDGEFKESGAAYFAFKSFNLDEYERHESSRKEWQRRTHPIEFEKMEVFRNSFRK